MSDPIESIMGSIEPLIRNGEFGTIIDALQSFEPEIQRDVSVRQQAYFYRAVALAMSGDLDKAQAILQALSLAEHVPENLRIRALNFSAMVKGNFEDRYSESLEIYQAIIDWCRDNNNQAMLGQVLFNQAIIYNNKLNNHVRAIALLEEAESILEQLGDKDNIVRVWNEQGVAKLLSNRPEAAQKDFEQVKANIQQGDQNFRAICEINLGLCLYNLGNYRAAKDYFENTFHTYYGEVDDPFAKVELYYHLGQVYIELQEYELADEYFQTVKKWAADHENQHFLTLAYRGLGQLAYRQEQWSAALQAYQQAVNALEPIQAHQEVATIRLDFQSQWQKLYGEAVDCALKHNDVEAAFNFSERARSRLLLDLLGTLPSKNQPGSEPILPIDLETAVLELQDLYTRYVVEKGSPTEIEQEIEAQEKVVADLRRKLDFQRRENAPHQIPAEVETFRQELKPTTFILSYFAIGDDLYVFGLDQANGVKVKKLSVTLSAVQSRFNEEAQIEDLLPDRYTNRLHSTWHVLYLLYQGLIEPIHDWFVDSQVTIYIIPDNALRQVPFHLLRPDKDTDSRLTANRRQLFYLPSVNTLFHIPPAIEQKAFLSVGYRGNSGMPRPEDLQLVEPHAKQMANQQNGRSLIGKQTKLKDVLAQMEQSNPIFFVGHNLYRSSAATESGFLLSNKRHLTLSDIQYLQLSGKKIVICGCESIVVHERGGDWRGLISAFLQVGVSQVMGTLWKVSELAMCVLMDQFWRLYLQDPTNWHESLQQAQTNMRKMTPEEIEQLFSSYDLTIDEQQYLERQLLAIKEASPNKEYPLDNPYYWGAFIIVGRS